jgi:biotin carboxyl carrier protein
MLTRIRSVLSSLTFIGVVSLAYSCRNAVQPVEKEVEVKTPVTIVPIEYKTVTSAVDLPAVATFLNKSIVRATTAGTIENISINPGDFVSQGQMLFSIRTREAMALKSTITGDSSLAFKGLINIKSNNEGVINTITYQKGDFVQEGDELAVISEQKSLVFILEVPFELDRYVEKNRRCVIVLPDKRHLNGTITGKLSEMDIQSQTVRYVVKPSDQIKLPANLIGSITLVKSTDDKAAVLPKAAVLGNETQTEFWVMKLINDSTAIKIIVTKGFENNDEVQIKEPEFLPTDRIILTGNYGLPDTARIEIKKE